MGEDLNLEGSSYQGKALSRALRKEKRRLQWREGAGFSPTRKESSLNKKKRREIDRAGTEAEERY